ncbi:hypothetical protein K435DRAFT_871552 [Dendrothele bispora CBS 962.96]|uniref:Glycosyl transferase CAP10 domain-containing protein n=1 Tax=Dendrothele bispora (strain CBS 962.96) TaxID=1314807 RepID=A0A4V4HCG3_DENBC|nr:hypothetical protein K435DRAFT_871552 [Dendrothele bispora CBS 962.96]
MSSSTGGQQQQQRTRRLFHVHQKSFSGRSFIPGIPFQLQLQAPFSYSSGTTATTSHRNSRMGTSWGLGFGLRPGRRRPSLSSKKLVLLFCVVGAMVLVGMYWRRSEGVLADGEEEEEGGGGGGQFLEKTTTGIEVEKDIYAAVPPAVASSRVTLVHEAKDTHQQQRQQRQQDTLSAPKNSNSSSSSLPTGAGFTRTTWSTHSSTLTSHHFNPNGLLHVNPLSPHHPIDVLISHARAEWEAKHARASTSLRAAVIEYERRYNRPPPRGFDKWWGYVEKHGVLLPDEYDQINDDLEHFWGIDPDVLVAQTYERETRNSQGGEEDRYTIGKRTWESEVGVVNWSLPSAGGDEGREWALMEGGRWVMGMLEGRRPEWEEEEEGSEEEKRRKEEERDDLTRWIPPFRATFSPHDSPSMLTDWGLKQKAPSTLSIPPEPNPPKAGSPPVLPTPPHGTSTPLSISTNVTTPLSISTNVILLSSPIIPLLLLLPPLPKIIHPHPNPPNLPLPCLHPHLLRQHTQFTKHFHGPLPESQSLVPLFSYSPSGLHHDITSAIPLNWVGKKDMERGLKRDVVLSELGVDIADLKPEEYLDPGEERYNPGMLADVARVIEDSREVWEGGDVDWEEKEDERLFWRGSNTGMWYSEEFLWRLGQRVGLMDWVRGRVPGGGGRSSSSSTKKNVVGGKEGKLSKWMRVLLRRSDSGDSGDDESKHPKPIGLGTLLPRPLYSHSLLDISFTGTHPISCHPSTCPLLQAQYGPFLPPLTALPQTQYKYLLDIDGNAWSSRFKRLMSGNSVVFKSTVYGEWWTERVQPWVHFVPVQVDLSDLWDCYLFFRGELGSKEGTKEEERREEMAKRMAREGREWSERYWRWEDMVAYNFRLFLEYARVMSPNRNDEDMQYIHPEVSKFRDRYRPPSPPSPNQPAPAPAPVAPLDTESQPGQARIQPEPQPESGSGSGSEAGAGGVLIDDLEMVEEYEYEYEYVERRSSGSDSDNGEVGEGEEGEEYEEKGEGEEGEEEGEGKEGEERV